MSSVKEKRLSLFLNCWRIVRETPIIQDRELGIEISIQKNIILLDFADDGGISQLPVGERMQYLRRTTLAELTGSDQPRDVRIKARELLELLEKGQTAEPLRPEPFPQNRELPSS